MEESNPNLTVEQLEAMRLRLMPEQFKREYIGEHRDHGKFCACSSPDPKTCYFLRYPNQMELNGADRCGCSCHDDYEEEDDEQP